MPLTLQKFSWIKNKRTPITLERPGDKHYMRLLGMPLDSMGIIVHI